MLVSGEGKNVLLFDNITYKTKNASGKTIKKVLFGKCFLRDSSKIYPRDNCSTGKMAQPATIALSWIGLRTATRFHG